MDKEIKKPIKQQASQGGRVMRQERQEESLKKAGSTKSKPIQKSY